MNQINIPSISIDTPIPYTLNLRAEGQPLHGLHLGKHSWSYLTTVKIWENRVQSRIGIRGEVISYTVRTTGFAPQTKRDKTFYAKDRAVMVTFINEWIAKTVERGLKEIAEQQIRKKVRDNNHRSWMAKQIEEAGGIEARRQQILREGEAIAAKEAFQYESGEVYRAIVTALIHGKPIDLDENTRTKIIAEYEQHVNESWSVKRYIDERTQELDKYLAEIKTEEAA